MDLIKCMKVENSQQLHNESSKIPNIGNFLTENEKISTYFNLSDKNEHPKLNKYNGTEEINKSYSINNLNTLFYSFSILSCLSASFISFYITKNQTYQYMSNYSPIEISIISNINSLIITSTFIIIFEFLKSGSISLKIIYWAIEFENNFLLILILGLIGTLNILFSIYSSINLKPFFLKIFKFFEIIFVDIFAMYFLSLYDFPDNYTYYLIIFNFFIALAIVDLSKETKYK
jgi:hypothetical protein